MMYFYPSLGVLLVAGWRNWVPALTLGLLISLMNDLFYGPLSNIFSVYNYNLGEWYAWQFGFMDPSVGWTFQGGLFSFKVTSAIMGLSIYARLIITCLLLVKWRKIVK